MKTALAFAAGCLTAIALTQCAPAQAGPYIDAQLGVESKRQTESLAIGYERAGWFVEAVKPSFANVTDKDFFRDDGPCPFGCGVTTTWQTTQTTTTRAIAFHAGKLFELGPIELGPFVGMAHYHQTVKGGSRLVEIDQDTLQAIIDHSTWLNVNRIGWAPTYGAMVAAPIAPHLAIVGRVTQYTEIDRRTIEAGLRVEF